jgi:hypothetical protein
MTSDEAQRDAGLAGSEKHPAQLLLVGKPKRGMATSPDESLLISPGQ